MSERASHGALDQRSRRHRRGGDRDAGDPEEALARRAVISVGGGSQAVGAITVAHAVKPGLPVRCRPNGLRGPDLRHAGRPISKIRRTPSPTASATAMSEMTFRRFVRAGRIVLVSKVEMAESARLLLRRRTTWRRGRRCGAWAFRRAAARGRNVGSSCPANMDRETLGRVAGDLAPSPVNPSGSSSSKRN